MIATLIAMAVAPPRKPANDRRADIGRMTAHEYFNHHFSVNGRTDVDLVWPVRDAEQRSKTPPAKSETS